MHNLIISILRSGVSHLPSKQCIYNRVIGSM
ncbi:hypothetical protein VPHK406_0259 [Vibrio phage K406]